METWSVYSQEAIDLDCMEGTEISPSTWCFKLKKWCNKKLIHPRVQRHLILPSLFKLNRDVSTVSDFIFCQNEALVLSQQSWNFICLNKTFKLNKSVYDHQACDGGRRPSFDRQQPEATSICGADDDLTTQWSQDLDPKAYKHHLWSLTYLKTYFWLFWYWNFGNNGLSLVKSQISVVCD